MSYGINHQVGIKASPEEVSSRHRLRCFPGNEQGWQIDRVLQTRAGARLWFELRAAKPAFFRYKPCRFNDFEVC